MFKKTNNTFKNKKMPILIILFSFFIIIFMQFVNLQNAIPVNTNADIKVIPGGGITGIKLYVDGVLVVGKSTVISTDNKEYRPTNLAHLKTGDIITQLNDTKINNSNDIIKYLSQLDKDILSVKYLRDNKEYTENIKPIKSSEDNKYKLGLWVKDGGVGIGTISFYLKENNKFVAIGHGITDVDTGELLKANNGQIIKASIVAIDKGKRAVPGQIKGVFDNEGKIGTILSNTQRGIIGVYNEINSMDKYKEGIYIGKKDEIKTGEASILCMVDNEIKEYSINIEKIYKYGSLNKDMLIKITDEELIAQTGGIVQGMSGSPIIQNNKLIGVVTHVLVNDPTKGFGSFAENMAQSQMLGCKS